LTNGCAGDAASAFATCGHAVALALGSNGPTEPDIKAYVLSRALFMSSGGHLMKPEPMNDWSLTSLKEKLIKIGVQTPAKMARSAPWPPFGATPVTAVIREVNPAC
jgi:hypothetical protein